MQADSALSHLYDGELCLAVLKDGSEREVRWCKENWCFFYADIEAPTLCRFDDIEEWRLASIKL